ncbi:hypothetical protein [Treponema phagedenis]|nr:hypothetical protein [Treponema phagedenis]QKS92577.1 hypothetical protein HPJ96_08475 [Treponema phagedenis]
MLFFGKSFKCFDSSGGIGIGSAGSAKTKALRRAKRYSRHGGACEKDG